MVEEQLPVSVIIPTYNRRGVLGRAIDSVLAQSRVPCELIVVDDGSTDGTADYIERAYPSLRFIRQAKRGVSAARNTGIGCAAGEWIAFLDSDDVWKPQKLERQWAAIKMGNTIKICHTEEQWMRDGKAVEVPKKFRKQGGWIFERSLRHCAISPSTVLIHRSVFEVVGLFDEALPVCEDYDLWLRITARYKVCLVDEPLIEKQGGHADQLSTSTWGLDRFRARALYACLQQVPLNEEQREAAREALVDSVQIVLKGARKHGNHAILEEFSQVELLD